MNVSIDKTCLDTSIFGQFKDIYFGTEGVFWSQIHKVPSTDMEALKSPLMGLFEKRRAGKFFLYVQDYKENDPSTHKGLDLTKMTSKELISWVPIFIAAL